MRRISASANQKFHPARSSFKGRTKIAILGGRQSNKEASDENCAIMGHPDNSGVTTGDGREKEFKRRGG
jgi:hypothetical protein